jgi:hypothetical protein
MAITKLPGTQINTISSTNIAAGAVDSTALASAAVVSGKIAAAAIDSNTLFAAGVVDANALADNSVDSGALQAGSVLSGKIANNAVTTATINANAVTAAKLNTDVAGAGLVLDGTTNAINLALGADPGLSLGTGDQLTVLLDGNTLAKGASGVSVNQSASFNFSSFTGTLSANLAANNFKITGLNTPTNTGDAANKAYVDYVAQGLDTKQSCLAATSGPLPSAVYDNGTSGVGATLTASVNGVLGAIDGVTLSNGSRVLVKNQTGAEEPWNGIYVVTNLGAAGAKWVLTRASDFNSNVNITSGAYTFIEQGTVQADTGWTMVTDGAITVGTTGLLWTQFAGAGAVIAGNGLTRNGNTLSVLLHGAATGNIVPAIAISAAGVAVKIDNASIGVDGSNQLQVKTNGIASTMIQAGAVGTSQLAANAVVTGKITDANVTKAKLNADVTAYLGALDTMATASVTTGTETVNFANSATAADRDAALLVFLNGALLTPGGSNDYVRIVSNGRTTGFTLQRSGTSGSCTYYFGG